MMKLDSFNRKDFCELMGFVSPRSIGIQDQGPGIIMRHDVDDDLGRSVAMAELEAEHNVTATYFILNTARYWNKNMWASLHFIRGMGHEIAWHNNVITQWLQLEQLKDGSRIATIDILIREVLQEFRDNGFIIKGSASHGDKMCYEHGYINYQAFSAFPKEGFNGKPNTLNYAQVKMEDYGLEYEAYAIPHDVYLSESGKRWRSEIKEDDLTNPENRVQLLLHPQHWSL